MDLTFNGKGCTVKVLAHSQHPQTGTILITYELEYSRFIHSELLTHRVFSKNSASSRAIPIARMIEQVKTNPAIPVHWGKNQEGMAARQVLDIDSQNRCAALWLNARDSAVQYVEALSSLGLHKQTANRILEPWFRMKIVLTTTEQSNWFELRDHEDAQPDIQDLAQTMHTAFKASTPKVLKIGEWHLPYVEQNSSGNWISDEGKEISLEDARKISCSCCAQVSYRRNDTSMEKADKVYDRLIGATPKHFSPFEHQATPILLENDSVDKWSGNFRNFTQYRKLLEN